MIGDWENCVRSYSERPTHRSDDVVEEPSWVSAGDEYRHPRDSDDWDGKREYRTNKTKK